MEIFMDRQRRNYYPQCDVLKGICILIVIVTHCNWTAQERLAFFFPYWINMAVPVFMVVTGFLYANSVNAAKSFRDLYSFEILSGKVLRLAVPFTIAWLIEQAAFAVQYRSLFFSSFPEMAANYLSGASGPGSYYFPIMVQFVFLAPLLLQMIRANGRAGLVYGFVMNLAFEVLKKAYGMNLGCYRLLIFRYMFLLCYGMYLYLYPSAKKNKKLEMFLSAAGIMFIYFAGWQNFDFFIFNYWKRTSLFAACYIIPFAGYAVVRERRQFLLERLGKASYEIFLTQMVYFCTAVSVVDACLPWKPAQVAANVLICSGCGYLFHLAVNPVTPHVRRLLNNWNK